MRSSKVKSKVESLHIAVKLDLEASLEESNESSSQVFPVSSRNSNIAMQHERMMVDKVDESRVVEKAPMRPSAIVMSSSRGDGSELDNASHVDGDVESGEDDDIDYIFDDNFDEFLDDDVPVEAIYVVASANQPFSRVTNNQVEEEEVEEEEDDDDNESLGFDVLDYLSDDGDD